MNKVLATIKYVIKNASYVKINERELDKFCLNIKKEDINPTAWKTETFYDQGSFEEKINYIFVFNTLNFCFWNDKRWKAKYKKKWYEGHAALFASLTRALEEKIPILNLDYLENLTTQKLKYILRGKNKIPLFNERLKIIKGNASILKNKFNGNFLNLIKKSKFDCIKIVDLLNKYFPSFNDKEDYRGKEIYFNKRAQLLAKYSYELFKELKKGKLKNYSQLTAGGEYKIPYCLRYFKILEYSPELAYKIDNKIEIESGSEEEIEIRAFAIYAIEKIKEKLNERGFNIVSPEVHTFIWYKARYLPKTEQHHRTLTIWY